MEGVTLPHRQLKGRPRVSGLCSWWEVSSGRAPTVPLLAAPRPGRQGQQGPVANHGSLVQPRNIVFRADLASIGVWESTR
eukprot:3739862-Pyramimonas_sp.AAC.1